MDDDNQSLEFKINILDSKEINLCSEKPKKRRRADSYDYDDPFFESFEGELDPVEIECKLENFFIFKGKMDGNPKKISRKYRDIEKKKKLKERMVSIDNKISFEVKREYLSFEKEYIELI
ncbi:MAG: hypothetical protein KC414_15230, partial [Romboutsia sp.]|nr:hypothetical protein [Romboutsia sp.]